jgi:hypothetical protein
MLTGQPAHSGQIVLAGPLLVYPCRQHGRVRDPRQAPDGRRQAAPLAATARGPSAPRTRMQHRSPVLHVSACGLRDSRHRAERLRVRPGRHIDRCGDSDGQVGLHEYAHLAGTGNARSCRVGRVRSRRSSGRESEPSRRSRLRPAVSPSRVGQECRPPQHRGAAAHQPVHERCRYLHRAPRPETDRVGATPMTQTQSSRRFDGPLWTPSMRFTA